MHLLRRRINGETVLRDVTAVRSTTTGVVFSALERFQGVWDSKTAPWLSVEDLEDKIPTKRKPAINWDTIWTYIFGEKKCQLNALLFSTAPPRRNTAVPLADCPKLVKRGLVSAFRQTLWGADAPR